MSKEDSSHDAKARAVAWRNAAREAMVALCEECLMLIEQRDEAQAKARFYDNACNEEGKAHMKTMAERDRLSGEIAMREVINNLKAENARLRSDRSAGADLIDELRDMLDRAVQATGLRCDEYGGTLDLVGAIKQIRAERDETATALHRLASKLNLRDEGPDENVARAVGLVRSLIAERSQYLEMVKRLMNEGARLGWPDDHPPLVAARALLGGA